MSTVPTPESIERRTCRVEGCDHEVSPLDSSLVGGRLGEPSAITWNHGFCAEHFGKIPRVFVEKWKAAKGQHALERVWRMIADDFAIEERDR